MKNKTVIHYIKHLLIVLVYLSFLAFIRLAWYQPYHLDHPPKAVNGVMDLRGINWHSAPSIPLNGEWTFYPEAFVRSADLPASEPLKQSYVQVPGDWSEALPDDDKPSFGYGTYRLRILFDSAPDEPLSFWVENIQSASKMEINGTEIPTLSRPASDSAEAIPKNIYYIATYDKENPAQIDLLVQVSNYDHPTLGGMVKSIRFGPQSVIDNEHFYSVGFELATFFILMLHALYTLIIYLFNRKERMLLVFFLLLLTAGLSVVTANHAIFSLWLSLSYTWLIKIRILTYLWLPFFFLFMSRFFSGSPPKNRLYQGYVAILTLYSAFILAVSPEWIFISYYKFLMFPILYFGPMLWSLILIFRMVRTQQKDTVYMLLAAASIGSSAVWAAMPLMKAHSNIYYPVDIIAAIICFSAYWFKRYIRNSTENERLNEQLKAEDRLKDQFLANTSHELRTPLHGMVNIAHDVLASSRSVLDGRSQNNLELLLSIGRRMSHLVDDLLDVVTLKSKGIELNQGPVRIESAAAGVVDMLRYLSDGKNISIELRFPPLLPPVWADEQRIVQVLFNLVHNAIKFTEAGTITIDGTVQQESGMMLIRVADTGVGMDAETIQRIFRPYEQGPHGQAAGGIGLGLNIARQLVGLHGGSLEADSHPGQGSVFSFTLPLTPSPAALSANSEAASPAAAEWLLTPVEEAAAGRYEPAGPGSEVLAGGDSRTRILAVDDDPVNLKVLSGILGEDAYSIRTATSANEALTLIGAQPWDLLILDVMMPHLSGYELTRMIRERYTLSELPILLLTARSRPEDIAAGFQAGANDYVTKPVGALELKNRVAALAALRQSVNDALRMEAAYLQAQIHPHFLFNTLNSILTLAEFDTAKMRSLGDAFIDYMRISIDFLNSAKLVPMSHELELVRSYLYIEQERFEDRLRVVWEVEEGLSLLLPPLTVQPLAENAVKHGLLGRSVGGTLKIRIWSEEGAVRFHISDDGIGMDEDKVRSLLESGSDAGRGIGLVNTHRRLKQRYGEGLTIVSSPGEGTAVTFYIPV